MMNYPRFFTRKEGFNTDAVYLRHDAAEGDAVVVTATGERAPHGGGWPLWQSQLIVDEGRGVEITEAEALELLRTRQSA